MFSCPEQNHVSLGMIDWVILTKNGSRMAIIPHFRTSHHHTKRRDITRCSSWRGSETSFALHFLRPLVPPSIPWRCHCAQMREVSCDLTIRFCRDEFSNDGFYVIWAGVVLYIAVPSTDSQSFITWVAVRKCFSLELPTRGKSNCTYHYVLMIVLSAGGSLQSFWSSVEFGCTELAHG